MPTYDYRCTKCGHVFELFHSMSDDTPKRCPKCRSKSVRVPSGGAGLLFKGSGFHVTDYRSKAYKDKAKSEKSAGGSAPSGSSGSPGAPAPSSGSGGPGSSGSAGGSGGSSGGSGSKDKKKRGSGD